MTEFNTVVILKKYPWHINAKDEADALRICENYSDIVHGVLTSDAPIVFKEVKQKLSLSAPEVKMIETEEDQLALIEILNEPIVIPEP